MIHLVHLGLPPCRLHHNLLAPLKVSPEPFRPEYGGGRSLHVDCLLNNSDGILAGRKAQGSVNGQSSAACLQLLHSWREVTERAEAGSRALP